MATHALIVDDTVSTRSAIRRAHREVDLASDVGGVRAGADASAFDLLLVNTHLPSRRAADACAGKPVALAPARDPRGPCRE